jgi:hypothetical protein
VERYLASSFVRLSRTSKNKCEAEGVATRARWFQIGRFEQEETEETEKIFLECDEIGRCCATQIGGALHSPLQLGRLSTPAKRIRLTRFERRDALGLQRVPPCRLFGPSPSTSGY